jgi:hypothetical protein
MPHVVCFASDDSGVWGDTQTLAVCHPQSPPSRARRRRSGSPAQPGSSCARFKVRGLRWRRGVDGAVGMREVTVDAGAVCGRAALSPRWLLFLVGHSHHRQSAGGHVGSCRCASDHLADGMAVAGFPLFSVVRPVGSN